MSLKRVIQLLREYARQHPPERLFSDDNAARLRARLAPVASGSAETRDGVSSLKSSVAANAKTSLRRRDRLIIVGTAAAAAIFAGALLTVERLPIAALDLVVDGAFDRAGLFRATRSADGPEEGDLFFVGVKVDKPAHVRIIALDDRGRLRTLALDRSGQEERTIGGATATVFGGYELDSSDADGVSRLDTFLVLASVETLSETEVSAWIDANDELRETTEAAVGALVSGLRARFRCSVQIVRPS